VARSPIGIVVPCHRVIAADGTLGGYGGGDWAVSRERSLDVKAELLAIEGVDVPRRRD
jgi:methylated-DNA-[protein]-cysteine S-methyltransferase